MGLPKAYIHLMCYLALASVKADFGLGRGLSKRGRPLFYIHITLLSLPIGSDVSKIDAGCVGFTSVSLLVFSAMSKMSFIFPRIGKNSLSLSLSLSLYRET